MRVCLFLLFSCKERAIFARYKRVGYSAYQRGDNAILDD